MDRDSTSTVNCLDVETRAEAEARLESAKEKIETLKSSIRAIGDSVTLMQKEILVLRVSLYKMRDCIAEIRKANSVTQVEIPLVP
jgi:predicted  nucleic acid-binding Zn-ribbon protein